MGNDYVREIRELRQELKIANLRSLYLNFTYTIPEEFRVAGRRAGYDTGYEAAWRGWGYDNPYTRSDCHRAYLNGYLDGSEAFSTAVPAFNETEPEE